jgi:ABC-2 type transport system permease protein
MSTTELSIATQDTTAKPYFLSVVRGEVFKITHNRWIWGLAIVLAAILFLWTLRWSAILAAMYSSGNSGLSNQNGPLQNVPSPYAYSILALSDIRGLQGIFVMVLAVIVSAQEYEQGTIRVLLARGVGRLRLLSAKIVGAFIIGVAFMVLATLIAATSMITGFALTNHLQDWDFSTLPSSMWSDLGFIWLTMLINTLALLMLGFFFGMIGRSRAFGLSLTLPWFFIEAIISVVALLLGSIASTNGQANIDLRDFVLGMLLGTNLNQLPNSLVSNTTLRTFVVTGTGNASGLLTGVSTEHALIVTAGYIIVFLFVCYVLARLRDIRN